jgi:hypothetical protein
MTFTSVQPRLQKLAEHGILVHTFDPASRASLEAVQALIILATWSPAAGEYRGELQDSALIATGAVKMARALHLETASDLIMSLRSKRQKSSLSKAELREYEDAMFKTRLVRTTFSVLFQSH